MNNTIEVWVVKDADGILRPLAGIWLNKNYGEENAREYEQKNKKSGDTVVLCSLAELINNK